MRGYKQLTLEEREKLAELKQSALSLSEISLKMGRHRSTIFRELKRNVDKSGHYWPDRAQKLTDRRREREGCLDKDKDLQEFVIAKIREEYWTPEQISGWLLKGREKLRYVCCETIYGCPNSKTKCNSLQDVDTEGSSGKSNLDEGGKT